MQQKATKQHTPEANIEANYAKKLMFEQLKKLIDKYPSEQNALRNLLRDVTNFDTKIPLLDFKNIIEKNIYQIPKFLKKSLLRFIELELNAFSMEAIESDQLNGDQILDYINEGKIYAEKVSNLDIVLVVGHSKVGKSTLINALNGCELAQGNYFKEITNQHDEGIVEHEEKNLFDLPEIKKLDSNSIFILKAKIAGWDEDSTIDAVFLNFFKKMNIKLTSEIHDLLQKAVDKESVPDNARSDNRSFLRKVIFVDGNSKKPELVTIEHSLRPQIFYPKLLKSDQINFCECSDFPHNLTREIEIANTINIRKTIAQAKSVKLLVMVNYYKLMTPRGLSDLWDMIHRLFGDNKSIIKYKNSILINISQVPETSNTNLPISLQNIRGFMREKVELQSLLDRVVVCEPLGRNPIEGAISLSELLDKIESLQSIASPAKVFNTLMSESAINMLALFFSDAKKDILKRMDERNFERAYNKLNYLLQFCCLKNPLLDIKIDEIKQAIIQNFNSIIHTIRISTEISALEKLSDQLYCGLMLDRLTGGDSSNQAYFEAKVSLLKLLVKQPVFQKESFEKHIRDIHYLMNCCEVNTWSSKVEAFMDDLLYQGIQLTSIPAMSDFFEARGYVEKMPMQDFDISTCLMAFNSLRVISEIVVNERIALLKQIEQAFQVLNGNLPKAVVPNHLKKINASKNILHESVKVFSDIVWLVRNTDDAFVDYTIKQLMQLILNHAQKSDTLLENLQEMQRNLKEYLKIFAINQESHHQCQQNLTLENHHWFLSEFTPQKPNMNRQFLTLESLSSPQSSKTALTPYPSPKYPNVTQTLTVVEHLLPQAVESFFSAPALMLPEIEHFLGGFALPEVERFSRQIDALGKISCTWNFGEAPCFRDKLQSTQSGTTQIKAESVALKDNMQTYQTLMQQLTSSHLPEDQRVPLLKQVNDLKQQLITGAKQLSNAVVNTRSITGFLEEKDQDAVCMGQKLAEQVLTQLQGIVKESTAVVNTFNGQINHIFSDMTTAISSGKEELSNLNQTMSLTKQSLDEGVNVFQTGLHHLGDATDGLNTLCNLTGNADLCRFGNNVTKIYKTTVEVFDTVKNAAVKFATGDIVGGFTAVVGGLFSWIGSWFGIEPSPSAEEIISKQIGQVTEMVQKLGEHIDERFDRVEQMLETMVKHIDTRFDRIESILKGMSDHLDMRFGRVETLLKGMTQHLDKRFDRLDQMVNAIHHDMHKQFGDVKRMISEVYQAITQNQQALFKQQAQTQQLIHDYAEKLAIKFDQLHQLSSKIYETMIELHKISKQSQREQQKISLHQALMIHCSRFPNMPLPQHEMDNFLMWWVSEATLNAKDFIKPNTIHLMEERFRNQQECTVEEGLNALLDYVKSSGIRGVDFSSLPTHFVYFHLWAEATHVCLKLLEFDPSYDSRWFFGNNSSFNHLTQEGVSIKSFILKLRQFPAFFDYLINNYIQSLSGLEQLIEQRILGNFDEIAFQTRFNNFRDALRVASGWLHLTASLTFWDYHTYNIIFTEQLHQIAQKTPEHIFNFCNLNDLKALDCAKEEILLLKEQIMMLKTKLQHWIGFITHHASGQNHCGYAFVEGALLELQQRKIRYGQLTSCIEEIKEEKVKAISTTLTEDIRSETKDLIKKGYQFRVCRESNTTLIINCIFSSDDLKNTRLNLLSLLDHFKKVLEDNFLMDACTLHEERPPISKLVVKGEVKTLDKVGYLLRNLFNECTTLNLSENAFSFFASTQGQSQTSNIKGKNLQNSPSEHVCTLF